MTASAKFVVWFFTALVIRTFYRIRTVGDENIPDKGGALLVSNHVTWIDALLILTTRIRPIRFVMFRQTYDNSGWLKPILRLMRVILVSEVDGPKTLLASFDEARRSLDAGELVCIFAEGALTRNGNMREFKPGLEYIVKNSVHPIIPVYLGGAWGSMFSYRHGKPVSTLPRRIPYYVTVMYGEPMPSATPAFEVRQAVSELASHWYLTRKDDCRPLAELFVRTCRRRWRKPCMADTTGKDLAGGKALIAATVLSSIVNKACGEGKYVGIIMPPCVGAALANVALAMCGRIPVNLNFTVAPEHMAAAIRACGIKTIISSRALVTRLKDFRPPEGTIYMEDLLPRVKPADKILALIKAVLLPAGILASSGTFHPDDLATVIFSSGTTGEPRGVMLSHFNIVSNIHSFGAVLRISRNDRMCAALPFFHSFGFTCTLWFPLVAGLPVCYHTSPLDGEKIAETVRNNRSTVLMVTPTFLQTYLRRAEQVDFVSLRYVIAGAEKLRDRVADAFLDKFGVAPLEGYGLTETSPVVSVNVPNVDSGRMHQCGRKQGTIGQPIPGVTVRIVDPNSGNRLPCGQEGIMLVKGPNVMLGYLGNPGKTAEAIKDGWYATGDIGKLDKEGFITITGRASRFSKIGGELVPHMAIEDALLDALRTEGRSVVVTSVADDKRGERLIVLYTDEAGSAAHLHDLLDKTTLPNLWKPYMEDYVRVPTLPVTGTGKLDLKLAHTMAEQAAGKP